MIEIRTPGDDDWTACRALDYRAFGHTPSAEEEDRERPLIELDRFRVAVDDGDVVGVAGSFALQMTLPGGAAVPTGGVTWVSVAVTHRRQGLMRRLMDAVHRDIDERGEPLAALTASEGGIYERFGYGIATPAAGHARSTAGGRGSQDRFRPDPGTVRIVEADRSRSTSIAKVWDRFRRLRAGEIARSEAWHRVVFADAGPRADPRRARRRVRLVEDRAEVERRPPGPRAVSCATLAAVTPEAHAALWQTVLSTDLVGPIRSRALPLDDPLPFLLTDQRVVRTTRLNDCLWCNVRDVAGCFGARTYGTDDDVVVEADGARWRIGAGGCRRCAPDPTSSPTAPASAPLLLGGVAPTTLAAGRRLEPRVAEALRRADALFLAHPAPYRQTGF